MKRDIEHVTFLNPKSNAPKSSWLNRVRASRAPAEVAQALKESPSPTEAMDRSPPPLKAQKKAKKAKKARAMKVANAMKAMKAREPRKARNNSSSSD